MLFICFSVKDRKSIVEPLVYQLTNYGFDVWYDRMKTTIGDDRFFKNFVEGVQGNAYATVVMSKNYGASNTMKVELEMLRELHEREKVTVFPILYEMEPFEIPKDAHWFKDIVFAQCTRSTGTRAICNNIACRISEDLLASESAPSLAHYVEELSGSEDPAIACMTSLLRNYADIDDASLAARVTLLFAIHRFAEAYARDARNRDQFVSKSFARVFGEVKLGLSVGIREVRLLENVLNLELNRLGERFT